MRIKDIYSDLKDGDPVSNLVVSVVTAGKLSEVNGHWQQHTKIRDCTGDITCPVNMPKYSPIVRTTMIVIKKAWVNEVMGEKILLVEEFEYADMSSEPPEYETDPNLFERKTEMPNVNDLGTSKYLKKEDVMPDKLVTIAGYEQVNVAMDDKKTPDMKWALTFTEMDKPLVLNKTNGMLLEAITGTGEFDEWIGKKVVLYNDPLIMFAGEVKGGIRIKAAVSSPNVANIKTSSENQPGVTDYQEPTGGGKAADENIPFQDKP